jgi:disulfide bond formation protein DsbB
VIVFRFGGPDCKVCRLIRVYLLVAVPVVMMMWLQPDFQIPAGIDGRAVVGYAFGIGVVLMVAYRYYVDIYKKRK